MIGNKDEADRCFTIARNYIQKGNYEQGKKLLLKAKRMCPDLNIEQDLNLCEKELRKTEKDKNENETHNSATYNYTHGTTNISGNTRSVPSNLHERNKNRNSLIDKILKTNNFYDILGVPKNCTEETIKSAYKKLARLLHPDKNKEKGAEEAFKKVSKAFQHLINKEKRHQYDNNSDSENNINASRYYDEDTFTPEDFFRNLFGVNFATCNTRTYRTHIHSPHRTRVYNVNPGYATYRSAASGANSSAANGQRNNSFFQILTFLIVFIIFILASHFEQQKSVYSLQRTSNYDTIHYTTLNNIRFYTHKSFSYMYPRNSDSRFQVEFEVEYKFFEHECNVLSKKIKKDYYRNYSKRANKPNYQELPESCIKLRTLEAQYNNFILNLKKR